MPSPHPLEPAIPCVPQKNSNHPGDLRPLDPHTSPSVTESEPSDRPSISHRVLSFTREVVKETREDRILFLSSALAFDALLASIPFMVLLLAAVGLILRTLGGGEVDLHAMLGAAIPEGQFQDDPLARVERLISGVVDRGLSISLLSVPLLLLLAARAFATVRRVLNDIFHVTEPRRLAHGKLVDFGLMSATALFLLTNGMASVAVGILTTAPGGLFGAEIAINVITFLSALGLFVVVYRVAPDCHIEWRVAWIAGGTCAVFFEVAKRGYAAYLNWVVRSDVLTPDAQLGGVMLLLAWFYLTAVVFLAAAELADKHPELLGVTPTN